MKALLAITLCLAIGSVASAQSATGRMHVAVPQFTGSDDPGARGAVLATLSDHEDVEVIGQEDIGFAAHRVKADLATPAGRIKIAEELKLDAWLDGEIDGKEARLILTSAEGKTLASVDVKAGSGGLLDAMIGERMWGAMGMHLSRGEGARRQWLAQVDLARAKLAARERELERQRELVQQRERERDQLLARQEQLARQKLAARAREVERLGEVARLDRQSRQSVQVAQAPVAPAARPSSRGAVAMAPSRAASGPQVMSAAAAAPRRRPVAPQETAGFATSAGNAPAWQPGTRAPASAWNTPAPGFAPGRASPSTQRLPQGRAAAEPVDPGAADYEASGGISPATQRWLAQQRTQ